MFKRRSHVIEGSACEHVCTCVCGCVFAAESRTEDRTRQLCSTGQCTCARSHVALEFLAEGMLTRVCKLTHVFQLTAGAEMDHQEGRESGSVCTSVVGRAHSSQGFIETVCFCV